MRVYPFGYSAPGASTSLDALMSDEKAILIDIRFSTKSMRKPAWSGSALRARYGNRYLWIQELGNVNYYNGGPIKLHNPDDGISRLVRGLQKGYNLILLCTCSTHETCHRKEVVDRLKIVMPEVEVVQPDMATAVPEDSMMCLSIQQPWSFLITSGLKDIENRDWSTNYRGPLLIHAGAKVDGDWFQGRYEPEYGKLYPDMVRHYGLQDVMPEHKSLYPTRAIIGVCDLVDVVETSESKWFCGTYGFVLKNARAFEQPIPYSGALKLFPVMVCHCCSMPVKEDESAVVGEGNEKYRLCYACCK